MALRLEARARLGSAEEELYKKFLVARDWV